MLACSTRKNTSGGECKSGQDKRPQLSANIIEIGEDNEKIWEAQHHLAVGIMLCMHRCLRRGSTQQQGNLDISFKTFGLMCASGGCCQLAVQKVPQIIDGTSASIMGRKPCSSNSHGESGPLQRNCCQSLI